MWSGRPTKDDEAAHTDRTMSGLSSRDPGNLLKSPPIQSEEERMTTPAEAILGGLENAAPSEIRVLLLNRKLHHGGDHVLELIRTGHLTGLVHLTDDHCVAEVLLAVVSHEAEGTLSGSSIDRAVLVLTVVHALEAIDEEEERLVLIATLSS